jgi:hypothetical protein
MKTVNLSRKDIIMAYRFIRENLYSCKKEHLELVDDSFHHNISYKDAPNSIKFGLLSYKLQKLVKNKQITQKEYALFTDECHVNGIDRISIASTDSEDIDKNKFNYNPYSSNMVDIIISKDVPASRNTKNYSNEYLVKDIISQKYFKSMDIRLLQIINDIKKSVDITELEYLILKMIECYNYLIILADTMINYNYQKIPIREMSDNKIVDLDVKKLSKLPLLEICKK